MKNDYFDLKKLMDDSSDKVDDELDNLNNEVCGITKGVGRMKLKQNIISMMKLWMKIII